MRVKLDQGAYMPTRAHKQDAGLDLRTPSRVVIRPHSSAVIDTGVHIELPDGTVGLLKSKSGLNVNCDLVGEGVIDSGYNGSIHVKLYNLGGELRILERGDKIIQLVILPCHFPLLEEVDALADTERGESGFGSTGR
jgi:dUTP pyrophosphatase